MREKQKILSVSSIALIRFAKGTCVSVMILLLIPIGIYSGYHLLLTTSLHMSDHT